MGRFALVRVDPDCTARGKEVVDVSVSVTEAPRHELRLAAASAPIRWLRGPRPRHLWRRGVADPAHHLAGRAGPALAYLRDEGELAPRSTPAPPSIGSTCRAALRRHRRGQLLVPGGRRLHQLRSSPPPRRRSPSYAGSSRSRWAGSSASSATVTSRRSSRTHQVLAQRLGLVDEMGKGAPMGSAPTSRARCSTCATAGWRRATAATSRSAPREGTIAAGGALTLPPHHARGPRLRRARPGGAGGARPRRHAVG